MTDLNQRLETARAGHWLLYHTGYLCEDRTRSAPVDMTARLAWKSYRNGDTALVQRRLGDKSYQYYAVKL
jgi:hypothetical protein